MLYVQQSSGSSHTRAQAPHTITDTQTSIYTHTLILQLLHTHTHTHTKCHSFSRTLTHQNLICWDRNRDRELWGFCWRVRVSRDRKWEGACCMCVSSYLPPNRKSKRIFGAFGKYLKPARNWDGTSKTWHRRRSTNNRAFGSRAAQHGQRCCPQIITLTNIKTFTPTIS